MTPTNPHLATNPTGTRPENRVNSLRGSARVTPALLALTSAIYFLFALGWSASGRNDLANARAASFAAVAAISISFAIAIVTNQVASGFRAKFGWALVAVGVGSASALQIASFNVLLSDNVNGWRPEFFDWIWSFGAITVAAGLFVLTVKSGLWIDFAAQFCGLGTIALAMVSALALLLQFVTDAEIARWQLFAPLIGLAALVSIAAIAWNAFRTADLSRQLQYSGLLLFVAFTLISSILELQGIWSDSHGLVALGRWTIPVATLGLAAFTFGHNSAEIKWTSDIRDWRNWSFTSGAIPWGSAALLAAVSVFLFITDSDIGPDVAIVSALCFALLIAQQTLQLKTKHAEVVELLQSSEELQRIANIDMLTGLPNRAALDQRLAEEFERAFRYEQPLSILFADIDRFKTVNDTLGHASGDRLLQEIANRLRSTARSIDFVARYGGEEFIVVAPGTWSADALILAERLRTAVEKIGNTEFAVLGGATISIGIAGYPEHAEELAAQLEQADKALYQAKASGRNRVVLFGQGTDPAV